MAAKEWGGIFHFTICEEQATLYIDVFSYTVETVLRGHCIKGSPALSSHLFGLH